MNVTELGRWPHNFGYHKSDKRLKMYFSPEAFAKATALVYARDLEIGWDMVIKPYKDGYKVFDVLVYPQEDSPGYVHVDLASYAMWKAELDEETERWISGNGHSHVNMESFASAVDIQQQHDEVLSRRGGVCFFQIWNRKMQIVSFCYDIDNKIFYGDRDIDMLVECGDCDTNEFIQKSWDKAKIRKPKYPANIMEEVNEFKQIV